MGNSNAVPTSHLGFFCVSDLHTDHKENMQLLHNLVSTCTLQDHVLIVAGDISSHLSTLKTTLKLLKKAFKHVFFVPGNSEFRFVHTDKTRFTNCLQKFEEVMKLCKELGVLTEPTLIHDVWVVPLLGWYTPYFDANYDGNLKYQKQWLDFYAIKWPEELSQKKDVNKAGNYFLEMNKDRIKLVLEKRKPGEKVITFSHFLPRRYGLRDFK